MSRTRTGTSRSASVPYKAASMLVRTDGIARNEKRTFDPAALHGVLHLQAPLAALSFVLVSTFVC